MRLLEKTKISELRKNNDFIIGWGGQRKLSLQNVIMF